MKKSIFIASSLTAACLMLPVGLSLHAKKDLTKGAKKKFQSLVKYHKGKKACPVKRDKAKACKTKGTVGKRLKATIPAKGKSACVRTRNKKQKVFFYGQMDDGVVYLCRKNKLLLTSHVALLKSKTRPYTITKKGKLRLHPVKGEPPSDAIVQ